MKTPESALIPFVQICLVKVLIFLRTWREKSWKKHIPEAGLLNIVGNARPF